MTITVENLTHDEAVGETVARCDGTEFGDLVEDTECFTIDTFDRWTPNDWARAAGRLERRGLHAIWEWRERGSIVIVPLGYGADGEVYRSVRLIGFDGDTSIGTKWVEEVCSACDLHSNDLCTVQHHGAPVLGCGLCITAGRIGDTDVAGVAS